MTNVLDDLEADAGGIQSVKEADISAVSTLATRAADLQDEITALEKAIKAHKEDLQQILRRTLPDAMDEIGMENFKLSTGHHIAIRQIIAASIPKKHLQQALEWLNDNGHGDLIKHELTCKFAKGQGNVAGAVKGAIEQEFGLFPDEKVGVHPQTLKAFCREQMEAGNDLPAEILGLYVGREATIDIG